MISTSLGALGVLFFLVISLMRVGRWILSLLSYDSMRAVTISEMFLKCKTF